MSVDLSLIERSACEVVDLLRDEALSPHDLLDTLAAQVARVEPQVNALPTLCFERAHAHADALLKKPVAERGLLCGLPVPIKDLTDVAGVRTTRGSLVYRDRVPQTSDAGVSLLEAHGGVVYAKSNTPEFGSGGHTYNSVFGVTRNPWDLSRSAGGSSGGAAAALASGTAWVAQGSIWPARCARRRRSAAWSACVRRRAASRTARPPILTTRSAFTGRWRAT